MFNQIPNTEAAITVSAVPFACAWPKVDIAFITLNDQVSAHVLYLKDNPRRF